MELYTGTDNLELTVTVLHASNEATRKTKTIHDTTIQGALRASCEPPLEEDHFEVVKCTVGPCFDLRITCTPLNSYQKVSTP